MLLLVAFSYLVLCETSSTKHFWTFFSELKAETFPCSSQSSMEPSRTWEIEYILNVSNFCSQQPVNPQHKERSRLIVLAVATHKLLHFLSLFFLGFFLFLFFFLCSGSPFMHQLHLCFIVQTSSYNNTLHNEQWKLNESLWGKGMKDQYWCAISMF